MKRKLLALLLALVMVLALLPVAFTPSSVAVAEEVETYALDHVQGGAILHCFNWSYKAIIDNMADIAKAGYTAVQTSPVQQPKDYLYQGQAGHTTGNEWWKLYQPLGFHVAKSGETWLCEGGNTLADLCEAAHTYGVKVIVDIVANHVANKTDGGGWEQVNDNVDPDLLADIQHYFHSYTNFVNDGSRFNMTQYQMGMPDLNTSNAFVQSKVLGLLQECIGAGVDGFRFDAAKHIELPTDPEGTRSDFWPVVINGAKSYTDKELYIYGEILGGAGTDIGNYTQYMAVTDNETGNSARVNAVNGNAYGLANYVYYKGAAPKDCVLWAESHDTFEDGGSSGVSDANIIKTWAIVGARADSTALFLARPGDETMGAASDNLSWKSTAVAEINKFKNHFDGTTEYVAAEGSVAYVERGTNGVVISNLGDNNSISITAHRIAPGTYVDQITQNEFIVANGQITGTVDDNTGVAVLYDPNVAAADCISASKLYLKPNENWISANARFAAHFYNLVGGTAWVDMTEVEDDEGIYELTVPEGEWTGVIFCRMDPSKTTNDWENGSVWNQTANLFPDSGTDLYTIADGAWSNGDGVWSIYGNSYNEAAGFYLIGNITDWSIDPTFKMSAVDTAETEEYVIEDVNLATSSQFKIIYSPDGYSKPDANYYPQGMGNNYGENGEIEEDGVYKIYFRPNYDGGDDWFYGCIYAEKTEDLSDDAGYYLIGSMTEWSVDPTMKLTKDSDDPVEYIITVDLVTTNQFKIVYSPDGTLDGAFWYPDGMGNNYGENGEIPEDGTYTVRFRPNGDGDDDWFYNCINVQSAPSTVPPRFDGKSLVLSGQLGMNFYLVMDEQYADGTMTFKVGNRDAVTATGEEQPDGRYKFTCYVTSVEMADAIVATYTYMDGEEEKSITLTESKTVNVENYLLTLIAAKPSDASLVKLCNAILYYGYHAQQYLSAYNHWTIGEDHAEMVTVHSEAYDLTEVMTALSGVTFKKPDIEGVTTTYKLRLDSETTVDVYFKLADADMTFSASATFGTETYTAEKQKDGRYRIRIPSISAHRLGEWIPITGTAGEETFETKVAVMAYVNDMLTGNYYPESNQLMAALFYYYAAVDEYEPID